MKFQSKLSIIIPSRNVSSWPFLQKTVTNLFDNSSGDIEVIVLLDGFIPDPPLINRKNLTIVYHPESIGMRQSINEGASIAKGGFIAKVDDHCCFGPGYDKILTENCEDNWLVIPSRYSLDGEKYLAGEIDFKKMIKYGPIQYDYLCWPYLKDPQFGYGFHGKKWHGSHGYTGGYFDREKERKDIQVDEIIAFQGSCWLMSRDLFFKIGCMQIEGFGSFAQEAQELIFKVSLSGGRCVIVKQAEYAHLHKSEATGGRGYKLLKHQIIQSAIYSADFWMNDRWPLATKKIRDVIENPNWWPLELWPTDWQNHEFLKDYDYSKWLYK